MRTIDPIRDRESLLSMPKAARLLPARSGRPAGPSVMWRYWAVGVKIGDDRVKLETVRVGNRRWTTEKAVRDFIARTNPVEPAAEPERAERTDDQLRREGLLESPRKKTSRQLAG